MDCPFCKCDPYEYVDVGVGFVPVAVTCCDLGIDLIQYGGKKARQTLANMRSYSPRKKARAMKVLREYGIKPERRTRWQ
ncbi:hypothetical protein C7R54_15540 [Achromobacter aloeverae]|uniref:Uncharacterized protein n=1 Tax=Achromobacter aloeverae TaxID=1750518 RepID=A0A4Q1HIG1_9BURK|nr:hypothetical protein C7R54_15540 [Achromobacter aloeverae]